MPASAAQQKVNSLDSVQSILNELLRLNTDMDELREQLVAKGVPYNTINAMLELAHRGSRTELKSIQESALRVAIEHLGVGAIERDELESRLEELIALDEDLQYVRKVARGFDLDPLATNMLTQIVRKNPGDRGQRVLELMISYARTCGIKVKGMQVVADNSGREQKPESVLPQIEIEQSTVRSLRWYRDLAIELLLGLLLAYSAIVLLT